MMKLLPDAALSDRKAEAAGPEMKRIRRIGFVDRVLP